MCPLANDNIPSYRAYEKTRTRTRVVLNNEPNSKVSKHFYFHRIFFGTIKKNKSNSFLDPRSIFKVLKEYLCSYVVFWFCIVSFICTYLILRVKSNHHYCFLLSRLV